MACVGRLLSRCLPRVTPLIQEGTSFWTNRSLYSVKLTQSASLRVTLPGTHVNRYATLLQPIDFKQESIDKVQDVVEGLPPSKLFAVVHISGRQFKVTLNDLIVVNRLQSADIGEKIYLEKVLLVGSENFTLLGNPLLSKDTVRVAATVIEHSRTAKVIVFKKKRRKNYKRKRGHRQDVSILRINQIVLSTHNQ